MHSKTFQKVFLDNEKDKDILNAQYVLVSGRIRKRRKEYDNVVSGYQSLFPSGEVLQYTGEDSMRDAYYKQLTASKPFFAALIIGCIQRKFNIIFLCTKNEWKLDYMKMMAEFIYETFGYPVYDYQMYAYKVIKLIKYDEEEVLRKCMKVLKKSRKKAKEDNLKTVDGRQKLMKNYGGMKEKELKKLLKKKNLYSPSMTKEQMLETLEAFLLE